MITNDGGRSHARFFRPRGRGLQYLGTLMTVLALASAPLIWADRTQLKPGWNMFSPQQDVEVGQQASREAEKQLQLLNDARVDQYLNKLGQSLAAHAPGERFPYQYKCVNDRVINAFALPGGFIYINRGVIEAADNEAQLAGVMAHETSHVALRHGTNQATKASVAQAPLGILGGMLGSNSVTAMLAQLGAGFAANSILLKYSRTDESQADIMGTQILYDSGYDPRAMGQFFEKIQAENKGGQPLEFFSDHPNPDHRIERVDQEISNLGGARRGSKTHSREFQQIKRYVLSRAAPTKGATQRLATGTGSSNRGRPGTSGLQILSASYGAKEKFADVRQLLQSRVQNDRLNLEVTNASMDGDPIVGEAKTLRVSYALAGRTYEAVAAENQTISIPTEQQVKEMETAARSDASGLRILAASYGAKEKFANVRQLLQSRVQNDRLNLEVTNTSMGGDPIVGEAKTLRVSYALAGRTYEAVAAENQSISIPTEQQVNEMESAARSNASGLRILTASYGAKEKFADVRQLLQSHVQNDRLNLEVTNASMGGDPIVGEAKTLRVSYGLAGRTYEAVVPENQSISIPTEQQVKETETRSARNDTAIERPSNRLRPFENSVLRIEYPDNWQVYGQGDVFTIAPRDGLVNDQKGNQALAYGVIVNIFEPRTDRQDRRQLQSEGYGEPSRMSLEESTDKLVQGFRQSNRNMRVVSRNEDIRVSGERALSTYLSNDSPLGGRETN